MFRKNKKVNDGGEMTFLEHLEEMRGVIIKSVAVLFLTFFLVIGGFHYFNSIMLYPLNMAKKLLADYVVENAEASPSKPSEQKIGPVFLVSEESGKSEKLGPYYIVPKDGSVTLVSAQAANNPYADVKLRSMTFMTPIVVYFYVGALGALGISLPFILYFVAGFVAPGLTSRERKLLAPGMFAGVVLFCIGSALAFFGILPMGIAFMTWMSSSMQLEMFPDAQAYYSLVIFATLAIGITFELPLVIIVLLYLGVVKVEWLRNNRRIVIVLLLVFAAIVTPPDPITQVTLATILYLMYEASMLIGVRMRRKKLQREAEEERAAEIQDEAERKEYAELMAKEREAEKKVENEEPDNPDNYEIDTSHYGDDENYGLNDYYSDEDTKIDSYIDYGRLARPAPVFAPDWNLNRKDTSFFTPDWKLNKDGDGTDLKTESDTSGKSAAKDADKNSDEITDESKSGKAASTSEQSKEND